MRPRKSKDMKRNRNGKGPDIDSRGYMRRKYRNIVIAQKINATNDGSGNPRRGWIVYSREGYLIGFVDEGYGGRQALTSLFTKPTELREIYVIPKEYREHKRRRIYGGWGDS